MGIRLGGVGLDVDWRVPLTGRSDAIERRLTWAMLAGNEPMFYQDMQCPPGGFKMHLADLGDCGHGRPRGPAAAPPGKVGIYSELLRTKAIIIQERVDEDDVEIVAPVLKVKRRLNQGTGCALALAWPVGLLVGMFGGDSEKSGAVMSQFLGRLAASSRCILRHVPQKYRHPRHRPQCDMLDWADQRASRSLSVGSCSAKSFTDAA